MNFAHKPNEIFGGHWRKPARVEVNHGLLRIQDLEHLRLVSLGVALDIGARERGTRDGAACGITDHSGEITDEKNHRVAQILKVLELADEHCVANVEIRSSGIKAGFHAHRLAGLERFLKALAQFALMDDLRRALLDVSQLFFYRRKVCHFL